MPISYATQVRIYTEACRRYGWAEAMIGRPNYARDWEETVVRGQARRAASAARAIAQLEGESSEAPIWREQAAYWDGVASKGPMSPAEVLSEGQADGDGTIREANIS